jgi:hypothetical protein
MKKGLGDKVLGWFVVQEDDAHRAPAPAPARAPSFGRASAPAVVPGQTHDARAFGAV